MVNTTKNDQFSTKGSALGRRKFLQKSGLMIAVSMATFKGFVSPAKAARLKAPFQIFSEDEAKTLISFAEAIVPGSQKDGFIYFLDNQLTQDPNDCMLLLKYFQIRPPYVDFYKSGYQALNQYCRKQYKKRFENLSADEKSAVINALIGGNPAEWQGPPSFLFYMFVRSDGVDVVYGTPEGFEKLDVPFMAHIMPPRGWVVD